MSLLFTFSCEDNIVVDAYVDEETSMKLWLGGVEVDVEATYCLIAVSACEQHWLDRSQMPAKQVPACR